MCLCKCLCLCVCFFRVRVRVRVCSPVRGVTPFPRFRPNLDLRFVQDMLLFDDTAECVEFMQAAGCVVDGWLPALKGGGGTPGIGAAGPAPVWNTPKSKVEFFKQVVVEPEEEEEAAAAGDAGV